MSTKNNFHQPMVSMGSNRGLLKSLNKISCGITIGNPKIAIRAEFPPAFPAIADSKVNKVLKLNPPTNTTNRNFPKCKAGLPKNNMNKPKAIKLMISMSTPL